MRNFLIKIDDFIWNSLQDGYLWLFDRTGIYVATIAVIPYSLSIWILFIELPPTWVKYLIIITGAVVGFLNLGTRYYLQDNGLIIPYNASALHTKTNNNTVITALVVFGVFDIIFNNRPGLYVNLMLIIHSYLLTVLIRDRDKKPFFELPKVEVSITA